MISTVAQDLKAKKLKPVYFFYGKDGYEIEKRTQALQKYLEPEIPFDYDIQLFQGSSTTIDDLLDFCQSFPLAGDRRLAIVKNFNNLKFDGRKYNSHLVSYFKNPSPHTTLVILYDDVNFPDKEPYKTMAEMGYVYVARTPEFDDLVVWVESTAKLAGKRIERHDAELLVSLTGDDKLMIEMQLEKLIEFAGSDKVDIDADMIKRSVAPTKQFTIFDFIDKVLIKDKPSALRLLGKIMNQGEPALLILFHLNRQFSTIVNVREALSSGQNDFEAASAAGIQKWQLDKLKPALQKYSFKDLSLVYAALLRADIALKSSDTDEKTVMFTALNEILI